MSTTRIVYQHVDSGELGGQGVDISLVGDVASHRNPVNLSGEVLEAVKAAGRQHYLVAVSSEAARSGGTDAGRSTGDHRDLARSVRHCPTVSYFRSSVSWSSLVGTIGVGCSSIKACTSLEASLRSTLPMAFFGISSIATMRFGTL